jgi:hypothetical protein
MKTAPIIAILATAELLAQTEDSADGRFPAVTVYIQSGFSDIRLQPIIAEDLAARMFASAGVRINWKARHAKPDAEKETILIDITSDTPALFFRGALAYASVYEGVHIRIFWDRIEYVGGPETANPLLAHVIVHELTHILQGVDRHSSEGLMKAHWSLHDILLMQHQTLAFDPYDVLLIHNGIAARNARTSAATAMHSSVSRRASIGAWSH